MNIILETGPREVRQMTTTMLRSNFLVENLIQKGLITSIYSAYDRIVMAGASPTDSKIQLPTYDALKSDYFLERREIGIINLGGDGSVLVDGMCYEMPRLSCLYIGKGSKEVFLASKDVTQAAQFFMISTPAHQTYPTQLFTKEQASCVHLGANETANERTIYKYIHREGIASCQLVMGLTVLKTGNIWNTMPAHTHLRRSEIYFYFDVKDDAVVFHFMGEPTETRHLTIRNHQAIISPPWSIHAGAGTSAYGFIWAMGGENQDFTDMDFVNMQHIL